MWSRINNSFIQQDVIKIPDICICLDAGTANYESLWVTSSLRGMVACNLKAQSIEKGQHSGTSGGIVPETFSVLRVLLDRLEDSKTGLVVEDFQSPLPPEKAEEAKIMAGLNKETMYNFAGFLPSCQVYIYVCVFVFRSNYIDASLQCQHMYLHRKLTPFSLIYIHSPCTKVTLLICILLMYGAHHWL